MYWFFDFSFVLKLMVSIVRPTRENENVFNVYLKTAENGEGFWGELFPDSESSARDVPAIPIGL